ncbi:MAG: flagellar filament outer layer protein FlaA [Treponema sp.]|jgi:hypothetical protein|nr:flagellar filament outer layer protein FlaA [Treponema sp.]
MKQGSLRVFWLVLLAGLALAAFGQDLTVNLESRVIESFHNSEDGLYVWRKDASRYAVGKEPTDKDNPAFANMGLEGGDFYPKLSYFEVWPNALYRNSRDVKDLRSMGIWGKFKRMGYNWLDIYPTLKSEGENAQPYEIPLMGRTRELDMWVWGSRMNYYMEIFLRDEQGRIHVLNLGNLNYEGWKNLKVKLPSHILQQRRIYLDPTSANTIGVADRNSIYLKFVKFRVWTSPNEQAGNFYLYFHQFKSLTDTYGVVFDGDEMSDPDWIREHWESSNSGN